MSTNPGFQTPLSEVWRPEFGFRRLVSAYPGFQTPLSEVWRPEFGDRRVNDMGASAASATR